LICDNCGNATHIDNDSLSGNVREAAAAAGFANVRPVIEVRGKCADCD
jgi:Fur family zinc uptake transcriptional regulator